MTGHRLAWGFAALLSIPCVAPALAQDRPQTASLRLIVRDPSGAVIPGALVQVRGAEDTTRGVERVDLTSDGGGTAVAADLAPGRYGVEVSFPGFETRVVPDVRVRAGENRRDVTLAIQKVDENVSVGRDPAAVAADPNGDRFNTVLTKEQIDALPDDPDEMEKALEQMAGPGATIRVDGFRGGKLPPKSQIRSIRFSRDMFAAEHHGGGMVFVDIVTQPGLGPLRGSLDFTFRDDSLNARNAFQPGKGPEQTQQYTFNMSGTLLKERTSFSLSATAASLYDSANVFAALADGTRATPIRRPTDRYNVNARLDHAATKSHTLRAVLMRNAADRGNLGVGSFDLVDRSFAQRTDDTTLRLSESGSWTRNLFGESRLQVRRVSTESYSSIEAPTIRVLDAFSSGGAQQAGGRQSTEFEWATNVDWARGKHSVRAGALVEGGWFTGDSRTNYLGTYTFASLEDYGAGRPATYSRRIGDPFVQYSHVQAGLFIQDDWRARQNLTVSAGLRQEFQSHLRDALNLAPRGGLTWSPFKHGKMTVRAGGGLFYDWLESETYEQTLRVDGLRQQELIVRNPGFPDPFAGGAALVLPTSKYLLAPDLAMPKRLMITTGVSHQFSPLVGVNLTYGRTRGYGRLRGRNINAPAADGRRPDPVLGNVTQVESTAGTRGQSLHAGMNFNLPARRSMFFLNYTWMRQENDADGPFSLPADSYNLAAEWGPAAGMPTHTVNAMFNTTVWRNLRVALNGIARSGTPYNITTGRDDNGDTVFNDRPAGTGRNSARTPGMWDAGARISYAFGFGERRATDGAGTGMQTVVMHRTEGTGGAGMPAMIGGGGAENKRVRFELFLAASNIFNHVNKVGFSGVMTSPFFGQPTAALPGRRVEVGTRIGF